VAGQVDDTVYDFTSCLKFIETRFRIPSLTARDSQANNIGHSLHLEQSPLPPFIIDGLNPLSPFH
jgi:hypothetical protein